MAHSLPIDALRGEFERTLSEHRRFLLQAPTGSGKSTRIPRFLLEWEGFPGDKAVWVLQPRRMAARLLARRLSRELGEALGKRVGYRVRFDACAGPETRLLFVTEGLLLRRLLAGNGLKGVGAVILDEFHERHLEGDLVLGLVQKAQEGGWPGWLGLMSATLGGAELRQRLGGEAAYLEGEGRPFPVDINYTAAGGEQTPLAERIRNGVMKALDGGAEADFLVFLPGRGEIRRAETALRELRALRGWEVLPLHGGLSPEAQDAVVDGGDRPRIILSTNIAETSVTLPRIRTVIDSGLVRMPDFDPRRGVNTLLTLPISRASAEQRAGRAGRVAPGQCWRLWSERTHAHRRAHTPAEVARLDLSECRLQLLSGGLGEDFPWLEAPPPAHWESAGNLLELLGASRDGQLTPLGREMAVMPLHPRHSRMLIEARDRNCLDWMLRTLALSEGRRWRLPLSDRRHKEAREGWTQAVDETSDLLRDVVLWQKVREERYAIEFCREWGFHRQALREAEQVYEQLRHWFPEHQASPEITDRQAQADFAAALVCGLLDRLGKGLRRGTRSCELVYGRRGEVDRESGVAPEGLFVAMELEERELRGEVRLLVSGLTRLTVEGLREAFPEEFEKSSLHRFQPEGRSVEVVEQELFNGLIIDEHTSDCVDPNKAAALLAEQVMAGTCPLKNWNDTVEVWIRRYNVLAAGCPELELNPFTEEDRRTLIEHLCEGATRYREIKDRPVLPVLQTWLPDFLLPIFEERVPLRFSLPSGGNPRLRYEDDGSVVLPARIQQLYDVPGSSLRICEGRVPLRLEILAPNQRPVQITDDLDAFWTGQYPAIRKELFGRYPKHEWR
jgi:ATP-dependent helicase HrpB